MSPQLMLTLLALVACPFTYAALCDQMRASAIANPPSGPFFYLFGTCGGWLLAIAFFPSPLAAVCVLLLITFAPVALAVSALRLSKSPERTLYHRVAILACTAYPVLLFTLLVIMSFTGFSQE